jgi:hypothetical protein
MKKKTKEISSMIVDNSENQENSPNKQKVIEKNSELRKVINEVLKNHKFFSIILIYSPDHSRTLKVNFVFLSILSHFFITGLFYEQTVIKTDITTYNSNDFSILVFSNLIALFIQVLLEFLFKNSKLILTESKNLALYTIKINKFKTIVAIVLCWIINAVYLVFIAKFGLSLPIKVSLLWSINSILSIFFDAFITSVIKSLVEIYIIRKILAKIAKAEIEKKKKEKEPEDSVGYET